jgi:DNA-binding NtrC family response regulator
MARARHISIQFKADSEKQSGSSTMLTAERVECVEQSVRGEPESPVVLVVDDDAELRESLVRLLAECDLTAVGAAGSREALKILERSRVDVVVSDHFVWGIDGVGLLGAIRERWPHVQRVLFTADAAPDVLIDAVNRAGVHKVLLKNMHAVQIRDEIERVALDALRQRLDILQI